MTSRRARLAVKRRDRNAKRARKDGGVLSGNDLLEAGLDPVDVEVADPDEIRELLSAQFLRLANLANTTSNERDVGGHLSRLSELDRQRNRLSALGAQVCDSVGTMPIRLYELTYEDAEAVVREHGFVLDNGKTDWDAFLKKASVETDQYNLKKRWREGKALEVRPKIHATLERMERERGPTAAWLRLMAIAEWTEIGRTLLKVPKVFDEEIDRLRRTAEKVQKAIDGQEAMAALMTQTPTPKKSRK